MKNIFSLGRIESDVAIMGRSAVIIWSDVIIKSNIQKRGYHRFLHLRDNAALTRTRMPKIVLMNQKMIWKKPMKKTVFVDWEKTHATGAKPTIKMEKTDIEESNTSNALAGLRSIPARQMKI